MADPRTRLDEIKARADAATEGPWTPMEFDDDPHDWGVAILGGGERGTMDAHLTAYTMTMNNVEQTEADAEFIAHARTDVPWLIEYARQRDAALTAVLDLHKKESARYYGTDLNPHNEFDCQGCGEGKPWPCPTVRAITEHLNGEDE